MAETRRKISLVIPAFNEEQVIAGTLEAVARRKDDLGLVELVVVDDGSSDGTPSLIEQAAAAKPWIKLLRLDRNRGKGAAVKRGMLSAVGDFILFTDADLCFGLDFVPRFRECMEEGADVVIGSRVHPGSRFLMHPRHFAYMYQRHLIGRAYIWIVNRYLGLGLEDTQCGAKGFRKEAVEKVFPAIETEDFAFDVEALHACFRLSMRIEELPVTYRYKGSPTSVRLFKDSFRMLAALRHIRKRIGGIPGSS